MSFSFKLFELIGVQIRVLRSCSLSANRGFPSISLLFLAVSRGARVLSCDRVMLTAPTRPAASHGALCPQGSVSPGRWSLEPEAGSGSGWMFLARLSPGWGRLSTSGMQALLVSLRWVRPFSCRLCPVGSGMVKF